jgi:hypothetical protein
MFCFSVRFNFTLFQLFCKYDFFSMLSFYQSHHRVASSDDLIKEERASKVRQLVMARSLISCFGFPKLALIVKRLYFPLSVCRSNSQRKSLLAVQRSPSGSR